MSDLSPNRKATLIETLFERAEDEMEIRDYEDYFKAIDTEVQYLNESRDFRDLLFRLEPDQFVTVALITVPRLRVNPGSVQEAVLGELQVGDTLGIQADGLPRERTILNHILDGIIRIWLMVDPSPVEEIHNAGWRGQRKFCDFVHGLFYPGQEALKYPSSKTTQTRDSELVAEMTSETTQIQSSLTHPLTASNMKKLTNITIYWTRQLDKHLEYDADYENLSVFAQIRWLFDARDIIQRWRRDNTPDPELTTQPEPNICPFPIPLEVIQETITSLELLFPRYNIPTNRFLKAHNESLYLFRVRNPGDVRDRAGSKVRLKEFVFYHDRLIELAQEFINPPKSWNTIFKDYRNPIQYWTFWIGLVIFAATVVSVVLAGVQVYYAAHPVT
ncbi:hypothetical protein F53441_9440 [Fusarium austroafricanum]|uniref:Uncharacterized protein n=1 Tax=Fusarium austroafricanum TaxID=2364996 RepID=A0A8H4NQ67_9HYPO|nr:hypothetical protein F53441_9440 [Fusarium austroafricanum]